MREHRDGTSCDFYVGLGDDAEWLGSLRTAGDPGSIEHFGIFGDTEDDFEFSESQFRQAAHEALRADGRGRGAVAPPDSWPWTHPDSTGTDYAVCFQPGANTVTVYERGYQIAIHYPNGGRRQAKFPRMIP